MTAPGEPAPEFTAAAADGSEVSLRSLRGRPVVLFFYPKAGSPGCTREAVAFARNYGAFRQAGVAVVGVSVDTTRAQAGFAERCGLPFPLVADLDGSVARSYGVLGLLGLARRVTFLIDRDGRVTEVVRSPFPALHVRRAVERLLSTRSAGRAFTSTAGAGPDATGRPP